MKLSPESLIGRIAQNKEALKEVLGVLLYGFDENLIEVLEQEIIGSLGFRTKRLTQSEILKDLSVLNPPVDLFNLKVDTLLIVENATDALLKVLEAEKVSVKLIIKGDFAKKSKIVKSFEDHTYFVSVAAYEANLAFAESLMRKHLGKVIPAFLPLAQDVLELQNQIRFYKLHPQTSFDIDFASSLNFTVAGVEFLNNALFFPKRLAKNSFNDLYEELNAVGISRIFLNHLLKCLSIKEIMGESLIFEDAIFKIYPPIFFKVKPFYASWVGKLSIDQIKSLVKVFNNLELLAKSNSPYISDLYWGEFLNLHLKVFS